MILAVDAGNTRIKWGLHVPHSGVLHAPSFDEQDWQQLGAVPTALANELGERWQALPSKPDHVVISNVAGEATRAALATALRVVASAAKTVRWLSASRSECGISNLYEQPERLGSDRWAALIGAWRRHHGAALVVNCGTATTVDRLSAAGEFRGGLILPGVELMKKSLMKHTANLGLSAGRFQAEPRNTADAIESGCLQAQAGAIERMWRAGAEEIIKTEETICFVTGGGALRVMPLLWRSSEQSAMFVQCVLLEHLTLEGLVAVALAQ